MMKHKLLLVYFTEQTQRHKFAKLLAQALNNKLVISGVNENERRETQWNLIEKRISSTFN